MKVLLNGQVKESSEAVISVFDHGFLYGMGLFETFRTYQGKPWLLERHADRLADGCRMLGIQFDPDTNRLREGVTRLLTANGLSDAYIRWSVSAGSGPIGLPVEPYDAPMEIVYAKPLAADEPDSRPGKTLRRLSVRRSTPEGGVRLKSFHYMNNIVAKRELTSDGVGPGTEGLFLDNGGSVCEGIVGNVFWFNGDVLCTPSLETGALPGITRAFVMELAASGGWQVSEGRFSWNDLAAAEEIFLTGSVQEVVPVIGLEEEGGRPVRNLDVGSRTLQLMKGYRNCAERGESGGTCIL
ncbi:4-amino-4-deoxychorismate lyase [Cohnella pontilimi]|uniref:4-amino-4-deoxychorismate lyase n=1 Tax=Cohnella pontilimi TaxID=2564100 RepID=A0A4U0F261_9BACL|nr:aminotransferase class IV [Cohnella pontilimi]TJY38546.1 4-amino-4-deoxychorismate lyase [Cohnella pontilimi]